jgi:hypothetical protein
MAEQKKSGKVRTSKLEQEQRRYLQGRLRALGHQLPNAAAKAAQLDVPLEVKKARAVVDKFVAKSYKEQKVASDRAREEVRKLEEQLLFQAPETMLEAVHAMEVKLERLRAAGKGKEKLE